MTRDEMREKCIEAMAAGIYGKGWNGPAEKIPGDKMKDVWRGYAARAFDALDPHCVVRWRRGTECHIDELTNPPEKKP